MRDYHSESDKVRDLPQVMKFVQGYVADIGCGHDKIFPESSFGIDARDLPGVDLVCKNAGSMELLTDFYAKYPPGGYQKFDTVFSSHFLEHLPNPAQTIMIWFELLKHGGHLVLYLPDGDYYNNFENEEHCMNTKHDDFVFWFKRAFCGEAKDYKGDHLPKYFEFIDSGMDIRENCYSFFVIARKV